MNGLRRTFLAVYSILLIAAAGGIIALAWNQDQQLDLEIGSLNLTSAIVSSDGAKWAATAVLGAVALLGLLTLVMAVSRGGGRSASKGTLRMRQADGGTVEVTGAAIENLLREELEQLPEVRRVDPRVRLAGGAIETSLEATIEPSASIAHATNLLSQGVANVLKEQVGVTNIRRPTIKINYEEMGARPVGTRGMETMGTSPAGRRSIESEDTPPRGLDFDAQKPQASTMRPTTEHGQEPHSDEDRPAHD